MMPTAILQSDTKKKSGALATASVSKTITHNNGRLYYENGRTYEYIGNDASGNRIYRDTSAQ
jgi:hypothetical protein